MSDFQESQELFTDSPSPEVFTQQLFNNTTPPGSPNLFLLTSAAAVVENAATPANTASFKSLPPLPMTQPPPERVQPIMLKRSTSVDQGGVAKVRKKRRTAAEMKEEEAGLGLLQTIPQACGSSWYNSTAGMAVQPPYPMAPPFQRNNSRGPTTTPTNWHARGMAILQVAASLGNVWANTMREKMQQRTTAREEEGHIYNVVINVENMLHVFNSE